MAYSDTRVKPEVTTDSDAGLVLDDYFDGEVEQLYDNDNWLKAYIETVEANLVSPAGAIKYGTNADRLSYADPLNATRWHETDTITEWGYDLDTDSWTQFVTFREVDTDGTLAANSDLKVPSQKATKTYVDNEIIAATLGRLSGGIAYDTTTALTLLAGKYEVNGSVYELASDVTGWSPGALAASTKYYVYLSPSAASLSSSDFSASSTAPAWDEAKKGYYDTGGRRCVGVFLTDGSAYIRKFTISADGLCYNLTDAYSAIYSTAPPTTLTAASLGLPDLGRLVAFIIGKITQAATGIYLYVADGDSAVGAGGTPTDTHHALTVVYSSTETGTLRVEGQGTAVTDSSGNVLYAATGGTVQVSVKGFVLPIGLRRTV